MKLIAGKIAMILILVILSGSFTTCLSYVGRSEPMLNRVLYGVVDIVFLPISLIALVVYIIITQDVETQSYLANLDNDLLVEYNSVFQKMNSLPDEELASLMLTLNSIPDAERYSTMEKFTSLSEAQLVLLVKAFNSLPESSIISSIEKIKPLPEAELVSLLQTFNSLTETELDSIIKTINSQFEIENAAVADNSNLLPEIDFAYSVEALEAKPITLVSVVQ
jgi:hypothetical protein